MERRRLLQVVIVHVGSSPLYNSIATFMSISLPMLNAAAAAAAAAAADIMLGPQHRKTHWEFCSDLGGAMLL